MVIATQCTYSNFLYFCCWFIKSIDVIELPQTHQRTTINGLILFEQYMNMLCAPIIIIQLLRVLVELMPTFLPTPFTSQLFSNSIISRIVDSLMMTTFCHRAFGGTIIAGARYVVTTKRPWHQYIFSLIISSNSIKFLLESFITKTHQLIL